jgi:hypothetical protein
VTATDTELRICQADGCINALVGRQRSYCSHTCSARESYRRRAGLNTFTERYKDLDVKDSFLRRGDLYEILGSHPISDQVLAGTITIGQAAATLGVERTSMTRALAAVVVDRRNALGLIPRLSPEAQRKLLGPADIDIPAAGTAAYFQFLDDLVEGFVAFRDRFFVAERVGGVDVRFVNLGYHRAWIRAVLHAIFTGGQQMILSPPRHGKSELLVHFCVWLICRNPDIRIMWVAKSGEVADDMVGLVKDELEHNDALIEAFVGPDGSFKPARGGWSQRKFTVSTRTIARKSSTMVGLGWEGTVLTRDVDFLILDDVIDETNTRTASAREDSRHKLVTAVDSRNETHTAFIIIGSRQHYDDFYGYLIADPIWQTIVEQAHDDNCRFDPDDIALHQTCMLWSDRHPYVWWYNKWQTHRGMNLESLFEMVYQNRPRPTTQITFPKAALVAARNTSRILGDLTPFRNKDGSPKAYQLVAGLDPAAVGHQAAWLWLFLFSNKKRYLLDADNPRGGGIEQFLALMIRWHEAYALRHWVVETANIQRLYLDDSRVREAASTRGIALDRHQTGSNKTDAQYGVPAMAHWYTEDMVDLPYGDAASTLLVDTFTRQAVNFDPDVAGSRSRPTGDLLMASWFPMKVIRALLIEQMREAQVTYEPMFADYAVSSYEESPW